MGRGGVALAVAAWLTFGPSLGPLPPWWPQRTTSGVAPFSLDFPRGPRLLGQGLPTARHLGAAVEQPQAAPAPTAQDLAGLRHPQGEPGRVPRGPEVPPGDRAGRTRTRPTGTSATRAGSTVLIGSRSTASATASYGVGSALTMTTRAPAAAASSTMPGHRVHLQRGAHGDQHVGLRGAGEGPAQRAAVEGLSKRDRGRLEDAAAAQAGRVGLAGRDPVQRRAHRACGRRRPGTAPRGWSRAPRPPGPGRCPPAGAARRCSG